MCQAVEACQQRSYPPCSCCNIRSNEDNCKKTGCICEGGRACKLDEEEAAVREMKREERERRKACKLMARHAKEEWKSKLRAERDEMKKCIQMAKDTKKEMDKCEKERIKRFQKAQSKERKLCKKYEKAKRKECLRREKLVQKECNLMDAKEKKMKKRKEEQERKFAELQERRNLRAWKRAMKAESKERASEIKLKQKCIKSCLHDVVKEREADYMKKKMLRAERYRQMKQKTTCTGCDDEVTCSTFNYKGPSTCDSKCPSTCDSKCPSTCDSKGPSTCDAGNKVSPCPDEACTCCDQDPNEESDSCDCEFCDFDNFMEE